MGRTVTYKYAVEFFGVTANGRAYHWTPASWNSKQTGRATATNLAKYIKAHETATLPGGVNAHLGVTRIAAAQIVLNDGSRTVVASYLRPLFTTAEEGIGS